MHVQYGTSCRDHIPLIVDISIESVPVLEDTVNDTRVGWGKQPPLSENGYIETHNVRMGVFALANYYFIPKLCFPKRILSSDITNSFVHHLKKCIQKGVLPHTWGKTPFCVG